MKVFVQWAKANPQDWQPVDLKNTAAIRNLPRKSWTSNPVLDNNNGWLLGLNVQGIDFTGYDHTAIEILPNDRLIVTGWMTDAAQNSGGLWATRWQLDPPAPDPNLGGMINTRQVRTVWANSIAAQWFIGVTVLPMSSFVPPPTNLTWDGVFLDDNKFQEHLSVRSKHGWREWTL